MTYRSEEPAQIFLLKLTWLVTAFGSKGREKCKVIQCYDNMCHVNNFKVAKKPLPLPGDLQYSYVDGYKGH